MAERNIKNILYAEIDQLNSESPDIKKAKAITKAAAQIVYKDRLEMENKVHTLKLRKFVGRNNGAGK